MDFDNLHQDEKILCLLNIFPDVDPIVINSLLENNLDYDNLIISLLEISDPTFKEEKNFIYPNAIYHSEINTQINLNEKLSDNFNNKNIGNNQLREKTSGGSALDKLKSIKNNITEFISKKTNKKSEYSSLPTVDWEDEDDDEVIVYDRSKQNKKKDFFDDYL